MSLPKAHGAPTTVINHSIVFKVNLGRGVG
jgi:hypothetical protein